MSDITKIKVDGELESTYKLFPKNREFEKRASGGGDASSADVFIIHVTPDETYTNVQLDKTAEQIYEAYQSGKYCLVSHFSGQFILVTSVETDGTRYKMECQGLMFPAYNQGRIHLLELITNDGVTWAIRTGSSTLYDVCFRGLKIYGHSNKLYTISVDADGNLTATVAT